jgi:transposase
MSEPGSILVSAEVETAKLNGLDPEAYVAKVLDRLARGHLNTRLEDLLPWDLQPQLAAAA